ncbi:hypothetical protein WS93_35565 [Burkholderia cepacia]|nr:hypothetical protein WS93_35565 [Burkholderia cepacia]
MIRFVAFIECATEPMIGTTCAAGHHLPGGQAAVHCQAGLTCVVTGRHQGESTGEPRQLENPYIRTEDVSAVIDYLTTLPYVDADRIGATGNQIITYDAYNKAEAFLTQPLQIVAGSVAGSKWMSDDLFARAASADKRFHVVEGANHMSLYDGPQYVDEAVPCWYRSSSASCNAARGDARQARDGTPAAETRTSGSPPPRGEPFVQ